MQGFEALEVWMVTPEEEWVIFVTTVLRRRRGSEGAR